MTASTFRNKQVIPQSLKPSEQITPAHLNLTAETTITAPELGPNELFVRNLYLALDPYLRYGFSSDDSSKAGKPLVGFGVSEVILSNNQDFPPGTIVVGHTKWEHFSHITDLTEFRAIADPHNPKIPLYTHITTLGMPGATAYNALLNGELKAGETLFVSSAAGAVGLLAAQLGKRAGLRVIGSAGSDEKVDFLVKEIGLDGAFNYKTEDTKNALARLAPNGVDVYFDNVAGQTLETVLDVINRRGRILMVGRISQIDGKAPHPFTNLYHILSKNLKVIGYYTWISSPDYNVLVQELGPLLEEKTLVSVDTLIDGLENAPEAFVGVFQGRFSGKVVVKVADM